MRKYVEENERMKRRHAHWLREAEGRDQATIDMALKAILRFEESTGFKNFKQFNLEQPASFKAQLAKAVNQRTGKPISKSTIDGTLRHVRTFFKWLADEHGYKSRVSYADSRFFNNNSKDARIAHAQRDVPFPTMEQCNHAFRLMPEHDEFLRRGKAAFALVMLTGARDGAAASLLFKHVDLVEGSIFQDAREVNTKNSKTFSTWFFPVDDMYRRCFEEWVEYLRKEKLFGNDDALFPKPQMGIAAGGGFAKLGLSRDRYSSAQNIRSTVKDAFSGAGLPQFAPHSIRKTLAQLGAEMCAGDPIKFKVWSMNLGHEHISTTFNSYLPISTAQQAEIMKGMRHTAK